MASVGFKKLFCFLLAECIVISVNLSNQNCLQYIIQISNKRSKILSK